MPSPQLENGYLKIANELIDALAAYRIPGEQMQCLLFIIRKTYGYGKKEDRISNSQFVKATGLNKVSVCRAIRKLLSKNIVSKKANGVVPTYCFNKHYSTWEKLTKKLTVSKKVNQVLAKKLPTKETITKEKKNNAPFQALKFLTGRRVDKNIANDWLKVRKTKRLANTETAFLRIEKEIEKSDYDFQEIIKICCEKGWGGFKASWDLSDNETATQERPCILTEEQKAHMEKLESGNFQTTTIGNDN